MNRSVTRVYRWLVLLATLGVAAPAAAQYQPRSLNDPATGENYHIEAGADFWFPSADMTIESEQLGIPGSQINLKDDLGLTDQRFRALQVQLRPARKHKLRFEYLPMEYTQTATLRTDLVFNGIRYRLGLPVNSTLDWKTYEFGYEYDFIVRNWGFVGFDLEAKYTEHYVDFDLYGTVNFTNNVGVKGGYRSRDVGYLIKTDSGSLTLKGIYFGAVVRY